MAPRSPTSTASTFADVLGGNDPQDNDSYEEDVNIDEIEEPGDESADQTVADNDADAADDQGSDQEQADPDAQQVEDNFPEKNLPEKDVRQILKQYNTSLIPMFKRKIAKLEKDIADGGSLNQAAQQFQSNIQSFGLSSDEANVGLQMASLYKTNPALLIQRLAADAQSKGVKLEGVPNQGVDAHSIQQIVNNALAQRLGPQQAAQQQQQRSPQQEVDDFYMGNPAAMMHDRELGMLAQRFPQDNLDQLWSRLQAYAQTNGFSLNAPLRQQFEARQRNGNSNPNRVKQENFNSRRNANPTANGSVNRDEEMADPEMSYKEIARQVRANLGI